MRQGSCYRGRSCSCCTHNGRWCHSHGSGPAAAVRASVAATGRRTQSGFRASVAPWRVGNSACGAASALCPRFAAWHVAHLMPPVLRRTRWLAAVGARTRRTRRTAQEGRARRAAAQGIYSGHAAAGSEAQDEPEAQRRRGGMQRRRQTTLAAITHSCSQLKLRGEIIGSSGVRWRCAARVAGREVAVRGAKRVRGWAQSTAWAAGV